jgi:hypothetical protein
MTSGLQVATFSMKSQKCAIFVTGFVVHLQLPHQLQENQQYLFMPWTMDKIQKEEKIVLESYR